MIKVGIIGLGLWGPNILRNLMSISQVRVKYCCDLKKENLAKVSQRYPQIQTSQNHYDLLKDRELEAVFIATPASTHFELARDFLKAGKHIFVEKPLALSASEAEKLVKLSRQLKLVLMVDHVLVYHPAVKKIREIIKKDELGKLYYFDAIRINLGIFPQDVNILWDLAVHDLSVLDYLVSGESEAVSAIGVSHLKAGQEDMAYITILFKNNFLGHIQVNFLAPNKVRQIILAASRKMLIYNELAAVEQIKIYDRAVVPKRPFKEGEWDYRIGDMYSPHVEVKEALLSACEHFLVCCRGGRRPLTDGLSGLKIVRLVEAIQKSIKKNGKVMKI